MVLCITLSYFILVHLHGIFGESCQCNGRQSLGRVYGGVQARPNEFPFVTYIRSDDNACTGVLISPRDVLTNAHCLVDFHNNKTCFTKSKPGIWKVKTGLEFHDKDSSVSHVYEVADIFINPNYFYGAFYNDIGLMRLSQPVEIDNIHVSIGCLHYGTVASLKNKEAITVGWGLNDDKAAPNALHKGLVRIRDHATCLRFLNDVLQVYKDVFNQSKSTICTVADNMKTTIAQGDSGGPLLIKKGGSYEIAALSAGIYVNAEFAGFYPLVANSLDWIFSNSDAKGCQGLIPDKRPGDVIVPLPYKIEECEGKVKSGVINDNEVPKIFYITVSVSIIFQFLSN